MQHAVRYTFLEGVPRLLPGGAKSALKMDVAALGLHAAIGGNFPCRMYRLYAQLWATGLQAGVKRGVIEIHIQDGRVHLNRFKLRATHYMRRC